MSRHRPHGRGGFLPRRRRVTRIGLGGRDEPPQWFPDLPSGGHLNCGAEYWVAESPTSVKRGKPYSMARILQGCLRVYPAFSLLTWIVRLSFAWEKVGAAEHSMASWRIARRRAPRWWKDPCGQTSVSMSGFRPGYRLPLERKGSPE